MFLQLLADQLTSICSGHLPTWSAATLPAIPLPEPVSHELWFLHWCMFCDTSPPLKCPCILVVLLHTNPSGLAVGLSKCAEYFKWFADSASVSFPGNSVQTGRFTIWSVFLVPSLSVTAYWIRQNYQLGLGSVASIRNNPQIVALKMGLYFSHIKEAWM